MKNLIDIIFTKYKFNKDYFISFKLSVYKERIKNISIYIYYISLMNKMNIRKCKYIYYRFSQFCNVVTIYILTRPRVKNRY